MDIDDLRLTEDERYDATEAAMVKRLHTRDDEVGSGDVLTIANAFANTQLAKTLRVLIDWLHTTEDENEPPFTSRNAFRDALLELLEAAEAKTPVEAI